MMRSLNSLITSTSTEVDELYVVMIALPLRYLIYLPSSARRILRLTLLLCARSLQSHSQSSAAPQESIRRMAQRSQLPRGPR